MSFVILMKSDVKNDCNNTKQLTPPKISTQLCGTTLIRIVPNKIVFNLDVRKRE